MPAVPNSANSKAT